MPLEYVKHELISLRKHPEFSEVWLQFVVIVPARAADSDSIRIDHRHVRERAFE